MSPLHGRPKVHFKMTVESAPFVSALVGTNPANADAVQQGADHLRLIKTALVASFPNISGAMTPTHTVLNALPTRVTALETNRARKDIADAFAGLMTFTVGLNAASVQRGAAELEPIGCIHAFIGTAPAGYLPLDGAAVSRTTYAALFALWGTAYGVGNGTTTFNVPDARGRFLRGNPVSGTMGALLGSATPAVTVASAGGHSHGITTYEAGGHAHSGVTQATAITEAQMPYHQHTGTTVWQGDHQHGFINYGAAGGNLTYTGAGMGGGAASFAATDAAGGHSHTFTTDPTGGSAGHIHGIYTDGTHAHSGYSDTAGAHTHASTVAELHPHINVNLIVRAI